MAGSDVAQAQRGITLSHITDLALFKSEAVDTVGEADSFPLRLRWTTAHGAVATASKRYEMTFPLTPGLTLVYAAIETTNCFNSFLLQESR